MKTTNTKLRILLTGAGGQVGGDLLPLLQQLGDVIAPTRAELDLADLEAVRHFVRQTAPHWIVNPAAYTAVDKAESEPDLAHAINAEAPRILGEEAFRLGAPVIHFSTDYVFDGSGSQPWSETDLTAPLGVYGATKLAGEQALAATGAAHLIFRTSWVYATHGKNFLRTILKLAREREELRIVADQYGAPTWSMNLARLATQTMQRTEHIVTTNGLSRVAALKPLKGIYHAADSGETTWFGFAQEFLRLAALAEPASRFARLVPISTAEYPTPARRPPNSRLNCERLALLEASMPTWQDSAAQVMQQVLKRTVEDDIK